MENEQTNQDNLVSVSWINLIAGGILKVKIPDYTITFLNELSDVILADDPELVGLDMSDRLAGRIVAGKQRAIPLTEETRQSKTMSAFIQFSNNLCLEWLQGYLACNPKAINKWGGSPGVDIYEMWVNKQLAGDYNPLHNHCQPYPALSSVLYLKVPEQIKNSNSDDGTIKFNWGDRGNPNMLEFPNIMTLTPEVGDYYIFPSWLTHEVPPFRGDGERRSISWNAKVWE